MGNLTFLLLLPLRELSVNMEEYLNYYDEVEVCEESSDAHSKAAIQIRNRNLVDRSDLIVCCIQRKSGGAYKTMQYAEKRGKCIINLADN